MAVLAGMIVMSHTVAFSQRTTPLFAVLSGGNEVSDQGEANAGDRNGYGSATVILDGTDALCFAITVNNIDTPTVAHIHEEKAGVNGDIVVGLTIPASGEPGTSSGCINVGEGTPVLTEEVLRRIRANPSRFYVNVHNEAFPGGAIRGQLF
jgi:hypothetical protein